LSLRLEETLLLVPIWSNTGKAQSGVELIVGEGPYCNREIA
jgi:hypothetical protein